MSFSTRVQPPKTDWLPKAERQPAPPSGFEPATFGDLLTPEWLDRTWSWFCAFREWLLDLRAVCDCPESEEAEAVRRGRPKPLVVPKSGIRPEAQGLVV